MRPFLFAAFGSFTVVLASNKGWGGKVKKVKMVKAVKAKKGYNVLPIDQTPLELSCPEGYFLEGDFCTNTMESDLVPSCLQGELRGNECVIYAPPLLSCPHDTILLGNICSRTLTADMDVRCPDGYDMTRGKHYAECFREIPQPPALVCPPEAEPHGEDCISFSFVDAFPVCPDDTLMEDGMCVATRIYDCTVYGGKKHGKHGGHGGFHHRMLKGKKGKGDKDHHDKKVFVEMPVVSTEVVSQECEETIAVRPSDVCPEGTAHTVHGCRLEHFHDRIERAVAPIVDTIAPLSECPVGFGPCGGDKHGGKHGKHGGEACCMTEEEPAENVCPAGMEEDGLHCVEIHQLDFQCVEPGFVRHGDRCIFHDVAPPVGHYTVTYECQGYACGPFEKKHDKGHGGHGKGHGGHGKY